jgi:hypothetical protein
MLARGGTVEEEVAVVEVANVEDLAEFVLHAAHKPSMTRTIAPVAPRRTDIMLPNLSMVAPCHM